MECNREEAIRARGIAERRMQNKDYAGAQKIALKAQQLSPGLDNLSQILTVCEVHISAELNVSGTEMDWYGILQVGPSADEASIKKQYRKLALLLHPDKNKFAGAESAFKLIGEAHRVLTDQTKRYVYDMKRRVNTRTSVPKQPPSQQNMNSYARTQPFNQSNFMNHTATFSGFNQTRQQQTQTRESFWTVCPFCTIKYEYHRNVMDRNLRCQNCLKPFIAYDMNAQGPPAASSESAMNFSAVPPHNKFPGQRDQNAGQQSTAGFQGNAGGVPASESSRARSHYKLAVSQGKGAEDGNGAKRKSAPEAEKHEEVNKRAQGPKCAGNAGRKRGKKTARESSEGSDTDSTDIEDDSVKSPGSKRSRATAVSEESLQNGNQQTVGTENKYSSESDASSDTSPKATIDYPDPEFHDFDKERVIRCFKADQIWAAYDDPEGLPRFYARIRKTCLEESKVKFTWLEANPKDQKGRVWVEEELPYGCGNFKMGDTDDAELSLFSHLAYSEKGAARGSYCIYPRKGDIWALFKGWDSGWRSHPEMHRQYKYEVVEVLSDYSAQAGVEVAYLVKLKGFVSLFQRASTLERESFQIPANEVLRFSHRIPHYRMTGEEREDVPSGSFELDPASMPNDIEEIEPSKIPNSVEASSGGLGTDGNSSCSKSELEDEKLATGTEKHTAPKKRLKVNEKDALENVDGRDCSPKRMNGGHHGNKCNQAASSLHTSEKEEHLDEEIGCSDGLPSRKDCPENSMISQAYVKAEYLGDRTTDGINDDENPKCPKCSPPESPAVGNYPDTEFHVFEMDKSEDKFQVGQIWALYSKEHDGMPKYYARIRKLKSKDFEVHVSWLEACLLTPDMIRWSEQGLPITCGTFELGETAIYDSIQTFSHLVRAKPISRRKKYDIYPKTGEVWALYKNWSIDLKKENCEYDMVEVVKDSGSLLEVLVLRIVDGFKTVFKGFGSTISISQHEFLRFSHQVPAFKLTDEGSGNLSGCWEIDPAAVPVTLFCSTSS